MEFKHTSVLLEEVLEGLQIKPDGIYVDGTLGGAGHAEQVVKRLSAKGRFVGIDQDQDAIAAAKERLKPYPQVEVVRSNYSAMGQVLKDLGISQVDGILLDLGVSSYQLDNEDRGFTYRFDAPLDMRMDQRMEKTAADIVNTYTEADLARILYTYGEERYSRQIARNIVDTRKKASITTTGMLADIVKNTIPKKMQVAGGHPAKRTFQAIRIELNRELEVLEQSLDTMCNCLGDGGRLCIITFHSLEDRIVKNAFRRFENPCICPPDFPVCTCGRKSLGRVVTRKPILPSEQEQEENSRSKSAKLRIFERVKGNGV